MIQGVKNRNNKRYTGMMNINGTPRLYNTKIPIPMQKSIAIKKMNKRNIVY